MILASVLTFMLAVDPAETYRAIMDQLQLDDSIHDMQARLDMGLPPRGDEHQLLGKYQHEISQLRRAAAVDDIDWQLDYSQGPMLELPELSSLRSAAMLFDLELMVHVGQGDTVRGAAAVESAIRLSQHVAEQELLISSLVGIACTVMVDESIERLLDFGMVDRDMAAALVPAYRRVETDDPFKLDAALEREGEVMLGWIDQIARSEETQELNDAASMLGFAGNRFGRSMLLASIPKAREAYDALLATTLLDDPAEMLAAMQVVEEKAGEGVYGPLGAMLMPAVSRCYERRIEVMETLTERRALLEQIASGELDPWTRAKRPWVWLLTARMIEGVDRWWAQPKLAEQVDDMLLRSLLAEDGVYPPPGEAPTVAIPWWLPGQWQLVQGLLEQARADLAAARPAAAFVEVDLALRMIAALAADGRCAPALVAAEALPMAADLVEALVIAGQDVTALQTAVRALPPARDAAGLGRSARDHMARLTQWQAGWADAMEHWEQMRPHFDDPSQWPKPPFRPVTQPVSDAAGVVAALTAIDAMFDFEGAFRPPTGTFGADAPLGLQPDVLDRVAAHARDVESPQDEAIALDYVPVDPTAAADATRRLREAVLQTAQP